MLILPRHHLVSMEKNLKEIEREKEGYVSERPKEATRVNLVVLFFLEKTRIVHSQPH